MGSHSRRRHPEEPGPVSRRAVGWLLLAVGVVAFGLYGPTLRSDFVYDAEAQILINGYIHETANFPEVVTLQVLGRDVLDRNRPLQLFSLMVDSFFWGRNPWGYHLTSNLLHALNAVMVAGLILSLAREGTAFQRLVAAGLGALIFACHPVLVEPVAEVACREDLLATGGILAGLVCAVRFARSAGRTSAGWGLGCVLFLFLAIGAKETGVVGPLVLLTCWALFFRRPDARRWMVLVGAAAAVVGVFLALRFGLQPADSKIFPQPPGVLGGSYAMAAWIQPRLWILSVKNIFWPDGLSADYQPANVMAIPGLWGLAGLAVFLAGQGFLAFRNRLAAFGMVVFWLGLAPVSNLIPMYRPLADRFLYLPMVGMAFLVAGGLLAVARWRRGFVWAAVGVALTLGPLGAGTLRRQVVFSNALELWRDTLRKSPGSDTAANNLGYALIGRGENEAALGAFQTALQWTDGRKANALAGAAIATENLGRFREAERFYRNAVEVDERYRHPDRLVEVMALTGGQAAILERIQDRQMVSEK